MIRTHLNANQASCPKLLRIQATLRHSQPILGSASTATTHIAVGPAAIGSKNKAKVFLSV